MPHIVVRVNSHRLRVMALESSFSVECFHHSILHLMKLIQCGERSGMWHLSIRGSLFLQSCHFFRLLFLLFLLLLFLRLAVFLTKEAHLFLVDGAVCLFVGFCDKVWHSSTHTTIIRIVCERKPQVRNQRATIQSQ